MVASLGLKSGFRIEGMRDDYKAMVIGVPKDAAAVLSHLFATF